MSHMRCYVQAAATFATEQLKPRLSKNVAPHSGRVMWVRALKERISGAARTLCLYDTLLLTQYDNIKIQSWDTWKPSCHHVKDCEMCCCDVAN